MAVTTGFRDVFAEPARTQLGVDASSLFPGYTPRPGSRDRLVARMRNAFRPVLLLLLSAPAIAADGAAPKAELFGGYSYTKEGDQGLQGGEAALAVRLTRWIALEADVSAHYGSELGIDISRLFFLGGLRFTYRGRSISVFTHYLAGGVRSRAGITVLGVDITEKRTDFAMAFGGGVDVEISNRWAIRAQADYVHIRADGSTEKEPRFSAGVVYRLHPR